MSHAASHRQASLGILVPRMPTVLLVGEVDEKLRVALDGKALYSQRGCEPESGGKAFKFCDFVGDLLTLLKADLHCITELVLGR